MQRSEWSSATRARVLARQRKTAEPDLFSITGWRGQGLAAGGAAMMRQSRDRYRLAADLCRADFLRLYRATRHFRLPYRATR
jgi:hypothetical protein